MQNELSCLPQVSQGWLLLSYMYSYTSLSHKGPYDAFLASNIQLSYTNQGARLIRIQGEGGNPLARGAAGETTPSPGCSCYRPAVVTSCRTPTSVHRGPCSPSSCKPHPISTRPPTRRLSSWMVGQVLTLCAFRRPPTLRPPRRRGEPRAPRLPGARSRTKQPVAPHPPGRKFRWVVPGEHCALEQYSLSQRRHPELPCRRPLWEVAPPRSMSWR